LKSAAVVSILSMIFLMLAIGEDGNVIYHNNQVETSHFTPTRQTFMVWRMEIDETFRKNLKALRQERSMDAKELSLKAGMGERGVKDIEEGRSQSPKLSTAYKLAKALNADLADMMGLERPTKIRPDLENFLEQFDEEGQARLLAALAALPRQPA